MCLIVIIVTCVLRLELPLRVASALKGRVLHTRRERDQDHASLHTVYSTGVPCMQQPAWELDWIVTSNTL